VNIQDVLRERDDGDFSITRAAAGGKGGGDSNTEFTESAEDTERRKKEKY
jgi:hypothetical protein